MSNTSSLRKAASLPSAAGRSKAAVRYDTSDDVVKVSNGTNWLPVTYRDVTFTMLANGSLATQTFFIASRDLEVVAVKEVHSVVGSDAGAVSITVTKDTGTNDPGAGNAVLSAVLSLKATANTTQSGALSATAATLKLAAGNRLAAKFAGVLTAAAGVTVTVTVKEI